MPILRNRNMRRVTRSLRPPTLSQHHMNFYMRSNQRRKLSFIFQISSKPVQQFWTLEPRIITRTGSSRRPSCGCGQRHSRDRTRSSTQTCSFLFCLKIYTTDFRQIFRVDRTASVDDHSEIILFLSLKGRCHGDQFLLALSTQLSSGDIR